ncbi:TetR/AcrR family transcriptional regulator [Deinococcus frigens]|uniref:TetR/AcrR family transcriptional regulator n=1 Tax=Deinococcus frigens TaxID=249403 RepID=UPI0005565538|nr:TetR/AcrR family transcriptional regulator [Deinococcus frigens]
MTGKSVEVRERIVRATAELLGQGGREAASTRSVSAAAGVQAPTIYRHFGDMQGLFSAVARETFAAYIQQKATHETSADPLEDLRRGWDNHVAFGLTNPAVYGLMYSGGADPSALRDGQAILQRLVSRVAQAGRLRVGVFQAAAMIAAAGEGVTLSLIRTPPQERDLHLSIAVREAVLGAVITSQDQDSACQDQAETARVAVRAVALHAVLDGTSTTLSVAERQLMGEWLERLTKIEPTPPAES